MGFEFSLKPIGTIQQLSLKPNSCIKCQRLCQYFWLRIAIILVSIWVALVICHKLFEYHYILILFPVKEVNVIRSSAGYDDESVLGPWHKMCSQSGNNSDYVKQHDFLPLLQKQKIIKFAGVWIALNLRFSPMFFLHSPGTIINQAQRPYMCVAEKALGVNISGRPSICHFPYPMGHI